MNPVKQIGRYKLPILNVVAIKERNTTWLHRALAILNLRPFEPYVAQLTNGARIHFTIEEKEAYDKALEEHELVLQVYGMCRGMGLRG
jgi:hypothetical protein